MVLKGIIALSMLASMEAYSAKPKTICGMSDDRIPSFNPKVARTSQKGTNGGCTLTMIGKTCAISAGHCKSVLEVAEFNTPLSDNGTPRASLPEDTYEIDQNSIEYTNGGEGNDWAVLRVLPNNITGKYAGETQGNYEVTFEKPAKGDLIRITGYGVDRSDDDRHLAQQTHSGMITRISGTVIHHRADTMGGNSGSSLLLEDSEKIIGIHTHGGCNSRSSSSANKATLIAEHKELKKAIKACLDFEKKLK